MKTCEGDTVKRTGGFFSVVREKRMQVMCVYITIHAIL